MCAILGRDFKQFSINPFLSLLGLFPNAESIPEESTLWSILQDNVPEKYFLSEKACQGVLRRAERRGKELPTPLRLALMRKCGMPVETDGGIAPTLTGDHNDRITDYTALIVMATQQGGAEIAVNLCPTITAAAGMSGNNQPVLCYTLDRASFNQGINAQFDIGVDGSGIAHTLSASKGPGSLACYPDYDVRRVTPTECGRLQGMPDWWCTDVPHSDSAEYKMWGNGMVFRPRDRM